MQYIYIFYLLWVLYSRYAIFDTPGQIEVFTWSASGAIITEALASSFATIVVYIIDTARSTSPVTFMSNMLYACSILYKTKLPFIVVLNKVSIIIFSLNSATQQRAKKVVSNSPGLVDFAIGLVNSVLNLPDGQVMFFEKFE